MGRFVSLRTKLGGVLCAYLALTLGVLGLFFDAQATRAIAEQTRSREALLVHNVEISVNQVLFAGKYQAQAYAEAIAKPGGELLYLAVVEGATRRVLAHSDPARVGETWDDPVTTNGLAALRTGAPVAQAYLDAGGRPIHDWAAPYLRGYLRRPEGIIRVGLSGGHEAELVRRSRLSTGVLILLFLLAGAALAIGLSIRLTSGLKSLGDAARRFGEGDYAVVVGAPTPPRDELDALGVAFDQMAGRLRAYTASIEARLAAFIENANAVIYLKSPDGRYLLVNRLFEALVERPRTELVGKTDHEIFGPVLGRQFRDADVRVLEGGVPHRYEEELPVEDEVRHYLSIKFPLRDEAGQVVALGGISTDITDRKRLEELLRAQYEKLQEVDRLKGEFVNAISHDLRTPLTSILGYSEFLEDEVGGALSAPQHGYVEQIQKAARRLESLVDDMLDLARIEAGTFRLRRQPADLREVVGEIVTSLAPQADEHALAMTVELPETPLAADFDVRRIQQVLTNLVHNALKFTPAGGAVTIRASRDAAGLRVEVRDTGPGIGPEDQRRLFQRFSQLQAGMAKGGTGLGLSISKAIVEAHGGAIGVDSEPGAGATFWFTLPAGGAGGDGGARTTPSAGA